MVSKFQCYLIIGDKASCRERSQTIAKKMHLDLEKVSADIAIIKPQTSTISITQVRDIKSTIFQKPVSGDTKAIIIEEAHLLTHQAQNALLKILEEPPTFALFILEAQNKESILKTILSRLIIVNLPKKWQTEDDSLLISKSNLELFQNLNKIEDPKTWIDDQIVKLHYYLIKKKEDIHKTSQTIEICIEAKKLLNANIYPKFVLSNLFIKVKEIN